MIEPFAEDVWTVARSQRFWGVETGTRMTIVRLGDGGLFVHCPVALDGETRRAVDALGPVRAVVASSLYHHLYVGEWMKAYPDASFHPCPGLERKRADLRWGPALGDAWGGDLDQAAFTARFEREIVFFHKKTRTLVCADALLNLSGHPSRWTRLVALLMANTGPGKGYIERIAVQDWALGRRQVRRILEWDIDGIVLAHGALVRRDGARAFREAYSWL
ncbi:MAG: DUF4336 domain-containing protein [Polyangiaceae bacterium]|nr:DUF4336 domain-containing protein [Polyangiaceae bacterium]